MFRGMEGFDFKRGQDAIADSSAPLVEPDDMTIMTSPYREFEPVKLPELTRGRSTASSAGRRSRSDSKAPCPSGTSG